MPRTKAAKPPRDDLAQLIADHLGDLPLPDGTRMRLMHHSFFPNGQHPQIQEKVRERAKLLGVAIANLIQNHGGFKVTHPNDPKPVNRSGRKVARAYCAHCGSEILHLAIGDDLTCQLSAQAIRQIVRLQAECPHQ